MQKTLISLALVAATFGTGAAAATCANRDAVVERLENRFGETLLANAVSPSKRVLEVFGSHKNDTWSIMVYLPERNLSCLAASGRGIQRLTAWLKTDI